MILIMQIWCFQYFQLKRPLNSEKKPTLFSWFILTFLLKMEQMFDERENNNYKDTLNVTADQ